MCYDEGLWQAFFDKELESPEYKEMQEHLKSCASCQKILEEIRSRESELGPPLKKYQDEIGKLRFNSSRGWETFANGKDINSCKSYRSKVWRGVLMMDKSLQRKATAAVVVAGLACSLAFTPVRSAAAQFLHIFRAEKMTTVAITVEDIRNIGAALKKGTGKIDLQEFGKVEFAGKMETQKVKGDEAAGSVDFALKKPSDVPQGYTAAEQADVSKPFSVTFTLDVEKINSFIKSTGGDKLLPPSVEGQPFTYLVPPSVALTYGNQEENKTIRIHQGKSPQLNIAGNVDVEELRQAVLELPFLPPNLKTQLAGISDWQHTLVVPNVDNTTREVTVRGVPGIYVQHGPSPQVEVQFHEEVRSNGSGQVQVEISDKDKVTVRQKGPTGALIWGEGEVFYSISGNIDLETAMMIAESLK